MTRICFSLLLFAMAIVALFAPYKVAVMIIRAAAEFVKKEQSNENNKI